MFLLLGQSFFIETAIAKTIAINCNNGKKGVTNDVITPIQIKINSDRSL
jgi:hypothetical protein